MCDKVAYLFAGGRIGGESINTSLGEDLPDGLALKRGKLMCICVCGQGFRAARGQANNGVVSLCRPERQEMTSRN